MKNNSVFNIRSNSKVNSPRINNQIRVLEVRLIDHEGNNVGVLSTARAMAMANDLGLDLVEISPNVDPPICKIIDHGKYKYEQQKKANLKKKNQKTIQVKEVKIRHVTDENDYCIKMRKAKDFLKAGHKVKFSMRFKGREISHSQLGINMFSRIKEELTVTEPILGKIESDIKQDGFRIFMLIASASPQT